MESTLPTKEQIMQVQVVQAPKPEDVHHIFRGPDMVPEPLAVGDTRPQGGMLLLPFGDWCDKEATLAYLKAEGSQALMAERRPFNQDAAGAAARGRKLRDRYDAIKSGRFKGIFTMDDPALAHEEILPPEDGEPVVQEVPELGWD
jgi:hypothetical protein